VDYSDSAFSISRLRKGGGGVSFGLGFWGGVPDAILSLNDSQTEE
jgi:hypothetical protein